MQHRAVAEASQTAQHLEMYRSTEQERHRGETSPLYDVATQVAKGTPIYGAVGAQSPLYTATVSPHTFVLRESAATRPMPATRPTMPHTAEARLQLPRAAAAEPPDDNSLPPMTTMPLPPLILFVGDDGVAPGLPMYGEAAFGHVTVIPRFRWDPPASLPLSGE
jgi:hypothetical protein